MVNARATISYLVKVRIPGSRPILAEETFKGLQALPTIFTHALVGAAASSAAGPVNSGKLLLLVACSMAPDLDVIAFALGIPYHHPLGHRGLFHSPFFALLLSLAVSRLGFREIRPFSAGWWRIFALLFLVTASHGLLDALTNGGLGIALLAPFDNSRYFFPWTPLEVSPIGLQGFLTERGLVTLGSEFAWVWVPIMVSGLVLRRWSVRRRRSAPGGATDEES